MQASRKIFVEYIFMLQMCF